MKTSLYFWALTVMLAALNLLGVTHIPWWLVLMPIWLPWAYLALRTVGCILIALLVICLFKADKTKPPGQAGSNR
jgi:hypothetical protein